NNKMFKTASLVACAVALLSLVNVTSASVPLPQWCTCGDANITQTVCRVVSGNFDGHTCGINDLNKYGWFGSYCNLQQYGTPVCWH
ncbi:hypothetical protein BGZ95_007226, partial [Linnemannia exigua]